jgi:hypothetical protein
MVAVTWKPSSTGQALMGNLTGKSGGLSARGGPRPSSGAVQQAVLDASAHAEIDILVVATNSRFSNPTRDWVAERIRSFPRPVVKLWDRDSLDRLVRQYPTVAARVLPEALSDEARLRLLLARFEELGEEPTLLDLEFFWERRSWLMDQESNLLSEAVAMFLYAEGLSLPRRRSWWRLLKEGDAPNALITALINMPNMLGGESRPRPLEMIRVLAAAGRMLIACMLALPDPLGTEWVLNPWRITVGGKDIAGTEERLHDWRESTLRAVLAFVQSDLVDACSRDCSRIIGANPHEMDSLSATQFWKTVIEGGSESSESWLVLEVARESCTVGLDMTIGCPLVVSNRLSCEQIVQGIQAVLRFRQVSPDDSAAPRLPEDSRGPTTVTFLDDHGMSGATARVAARGHGRTTG